MRIDSMATIGALLKGPLSERKRIRSPGRAWLNFCRREIAEKQVSVEHVSSHTGSVTPEQKGNDAAEQVSSSRRINCTSSLSSIDGRTSYPRVQRIKRSRRPPHFL